MTEVGSVHGTPWRFAPKLVGGIDYSSGESTPHRSTCTKTTRSATFENGRKKRDELWRIADAATCYWRARMKMGWAVSFAQNVGAAEGRLHPSIDDVGQLRLVEQYREALMKQLLTPAPNLAAVSWKQKVFAKGDHRFTNVEPERIERAITEDEVFLAAHPVRRGKRHNSGG
jgi:hypothetical protein